MDTNHTAASDEPLEFLDSVQFDLMPDSARGTSDNEAILP